MSNQAKLDTFDNVVVLMLENRSFDNLLGYLYEDGVPTGKSYEGLQNKTFKIPVPPRAKDYDQHKFIEPYQAEDYHQPFPDPGEVYQHVNTQLFNHVDPDNLKVEACKMKSPYNIPEFMPLPPDKMQGFINDYVNTLDALTGKKGKDYNNPGYNMYNKIMACFKPVQIPVLTTLAKEFAVFDHWFCSVPSQTWCNRAFWHAATSGGEVVNPTDECGIIDKFEAMLRWRREVWSQSTIFERMENKGVSHAVYTEDIASLTTMVNGPFKHQHTVHTGDKLIKFKKHINEGKLPQYTFLEPKFYGQHNDQHPSSADWSPVDSRTHIGTVLLGEKLIWDVYTSLFVNPKSKYRDNTVLIITYDEHGGCFDHVPPPPAVPPKKGMIGDKNFGFDRLGVRVPMVMVSANIQKNTIMNDVFDHSSFIKTMCTKWKMEGLTDRDKAASSFEEVFSLNKRDDFPSIPEPIIPEINSDSYNKDPLNDLQKTILIGASFIAKNNTDNANIPIDYTQLKNINTVGEAHNFIAQIRHLLPSKD